MKEATPPTNRALVQIKLPPEIEKVVMMLEASYGPKENSIEPKLMSVIVVKANKPLVSRVPSGLTTNFDASEQEIVMVDPLAM